MKLTAASRADASGKDGSTLQLFERARADHTATLDEHDVVRQTLDLAEVVRDVKNRDGKRRVQLLKKREDVFLGEPVERGQRLIHEQKLGL